MRPLRKTSIALSLACLVAMHAGAAPATTHERLTTLAQGYVQTLAALEPMQATVLGIEGHDGELVIPSEAGRARLVARLQGWTRELAAITRATGPGLALVDADDARLLQAQFDAELDELLLRQTDRKNYTGPGLALTGVLFTQFLHLPVPGRDGTTQADLDRAWDDITQRMALGPGPSPAKVPSITANRPGWISCWIISRSTRVSWIQVWV